MNKGVLSLVIGVIAICIGYYRTHYYPIADIVFFFGYTLIISVITLFSCKSITKALDFLYQAMPIGWAYIGVFTMFDSKAADAGQSFLAIIGVEIFLLPYQFFSSIVMVVRQFSRNELNDIGLLRLILCISIIGLLLLVLIANRNCWAVQDILTFSNKSVIDYKSYYEVHKGNFGAIPLCRQLTYLNDGFVSEEIFPFCIIPLFFILTVIERSLDIIKIIKNRESRE